MNAEPIFVQLLLLHRISIHKECRGNSFYKACYFQMSYAAYIDCRYINNCKYKRFSTKFISDIC